MAIELKARKMLKKFSASEGPRHGPTEQRLVAMRSIITQLGMIALSLWSYSISALLMILDADKSLHFMPKNTLSTVCTSVSEPLMCDP